MKFIECRLSDLKVGDFVKITRPVSPYLNLYGYVRIIDGIKYYQCRHATQVFSDGTY